MTDGSQCAETLPYGPNPVTDTSTPYVSTQLKNTLHSEWQQVLTSTTGSTVSITWQFSSVRSLQDRFQTAVTVGEAVAWTITSAGSTYYKSGTWRFSSGAGDMLTRFASSGTSFSNDDGVWGGGTGLVDGDSISLPSDFWGHGNQDRGDSGCRFMYNSGGATVSRSQMYLVPMGEFPHPNITLRSVVCLTFTQALLFRFVGYRFNTYLRLLSNPCMPSQVVDLVTYSKCTYRTYIPHIFQMYIYFN